MQGRVYNINTVYKEGLQSRSATASLLLIKRNQSVHKVALKTCSSTSKSTTYDQQQKVLTQTVRSLPPNHHYSPRPEKNKRNMRSKKPHRIKQIQKLLSSPFINAQGTTEEILQ